MKPSVSIRVVDLADKELMDTSHGCHDGGRSNAEPIAWQFTNEQARVKLKSLYPAL